MFRTKNVLPTVESRDTPPYLISRVITASGGSRDPAREAALGTGLLAHRLRHRVRLPNRLPKKGRGKATPSRGRAFSGGFWAASSNIVGGPSRPFCGAVSGP